MISVYAILSTLSLILPIIFKKIKTVCDENHISYDVTVHLGRTLSRRNSQSVNIDVNTKDRADKNKRIWSKAQQIPNRW